MKKFLEWLAKLFEPKAPTPALPAPKPEVPAPVKDLKLNSVLFSSVFNRGKAPESFLRELIAWGQKAPDEIFAPNANDDIYSLVYTKLGPYKSPLERRAVMLEVLRVLGGFESSWDWSEGRDTTNSGSGKPCTEEAGLFQCSGNSVGFDKSLAALFKKHSGLNWGGGTESCDMFRKMSKADHVYCIEHTARLLRFTVNHHGPVKRGEIIDWLKPDCVKAFMEILSGEVHILPIVPTKTPWVDIAKKELGVKEVSGSGDNPRIVEYHETTTLDKEDAEEDETPWCSSFMNWVFVKAGLKGTNSAAAISWTKWGKKLQEPHYGCVAVYSRTGGNHVGLWMGESGASDLLLAGNQGDKVSEEYVSKSRLRGYYWPA